MARWKSYKNKADKCFYCLLSVQELKSRGIYMTVDHVIPKGKGGSDEAENLVTACERCNNAKNDSLMWYEGCVALEGCGNPQWFRDMIESEERSNENGKHLEDSEIESRGTEEDS